jgi:drug/metabolite transporter (DMT)-like permease
LAGVALLSTRYSELRRGRERGGASVLTSGAGSAALSSFLFGVVYVGVGYATPSVGFVLPVVLLRGMGALCGFLAAPLLHESVRPSRASFSKVILAMGGLEATGFLSFNYGLTLGVNSIPVVAALSGMGGAVAASYAIIFLRERLERNQVLGLGLSLLGVFLLLYVGA